MILNPQNAAGSQLGKPAVEQSEITHESEQLDKAIQQTFENARQLVQRLQPVIMSYPKTEQPEKNPEEVMTALGGQLRRQRKSVEGINDTLVDLLGSLRL